MLFCFVFCHSVQGWKCNRWVRVFTWSYLSSLLWSKCTSMMSTEHSLRNTEKITTHNFLEETYDITRLLIFFINKITKTFAKTHTKNQEKFDDSKVNNACSVAPPNEMEQKSMIRPLLLCIKEQIHRFESQWWRHNSAINECIHAFRATEVHWSRSMQLKNTPSRSNSAYQF